ncbi:MAG: response regulator [Cryomorphaceae bacterium]|nr:response regulator [Cryomorphaceae bacterium]
MEILILDDHEVIRLVIKQKVLEIVPNANFNEYSTVTEALDHLAKNLPVDYVVSDLELTEGYNLKLMEAARGLGIPVLIFSSHVNKDLINRIEHLSVPCYVSKTSGVSALKLGLQSLLHGQTHYCPLVRQTINSSDSFKETRPLRLTEGQIKVLKEIQKGYSRKEVAKQLKIKTTTVANQIAKAREINDCNSQDELMRRFRFWEV